MPNKILIDEETLETTVRMLEKLKHRYEWNARRVEIEKRSDWQEKMAKYELKAGEVALVLAELYYALDND